MYSLSAGTPDNARSEDRALFLAVTVGRKEILTHVVDLWMIEFEVNEQFCGVEGKDAKKYGQDEGRHDPYSRGEIRRFCGGQLSREQAYRRRPWRWAG